MLKDDGYDDFDTLWTRGPTGKDELLYYGSDSHEDMLDFGDIDNEIMEEDQQLLDPQKKKLYQQYLYDNWKRNNRNEKSVDPK